MHEKLSDGYRAEEHYAELFSQLRAKDALIAELVGAIAELLEWTHSDSEDQTAAILACQDAYAHAREQQPTEEPADA